MKRITWTAPAEVTPTGSQPCDCYWHRRVFSHVRLGPPVIDVNWESTCLPLGRTVIRTDYDDGSIGWQMTIPMEGARFLLFRTVTFGRVRFDALIDGVTRLAPDNDHSRRPEGGDPTLVWALPPQVGRARFPSGSQLIVWPEAWWWRPVLTDGRLVDPLASAGRQEHLSGRQTV